MIPRPCTFESFTGSLISLNELRDGRPMVLNFWASWCSYCIQEMPDFEAVSIQNRDKVQFLGLDLLGVQAESKVTARDFAKQTHVTYPLAFDKGGKFYSSVSPRTLMPTTLFVKADGSIAYRQFGPLNAGELRRLISEHLV